MLQLSDLAKAFGGQQLFSELTWRIRPGDRWGLVGPNGVGKTTLLLILAGEVEPDGGDVASPRGWRVGYLAQEVRRSGRGAVLDETLAAVPEAGAVELDMRRVEAEMATAAPEEAAALGRRYAALQDSFQALDGFSLEARAKEILGGLGFSEEDFDRPVAELSGGWAMRVALAGLLLAEPDLLLLDEPTNHLDLESLEWLEGFLAGYSGAWVVVSHDRYFLNRMVEGIADLHAGGVDLYPGTYDEAVAARQALQEQQVRAAEDQARRVAQIERFINRFRADKRRAGQVKSRVKMLQRMERVEAPGPRGRGVRLRVPDPPRSGRVAISLQGVRKTYPTAGGGDHLVYPSLDFEALRGEHVALVGVNGAGKSTLLRVLAGATDIQAGTRRLGHNVSLHFYAQHQTDALHPRHTVLQEVRAVLPQATESSVRGLLGAFLFSGEDVDKPVSVLSGGEKARVALARMLANPANLLLLDEPTNHLDLESREVLEEALADFAGTIVFVSHDRTFINRVATHVVEVRVGGETHRYPGDYDYWRWKREEARRLANPEPSAPRARAPRQALRPRKRPGGLSKNLRRKLEEEVAAAEAAVEATEARITEIDGLLDDPAVYSDAERVQTLSEERGGLETRLEEALAHWEERSERLAEDDAAKEGRDAPTSWQGQAPGVRG